MLAVQIVMLAPMAPHFASTLWAGFVSAPGRINVNWDQISWDNNVMNQKWPQVDNNYVLNLYCVVCNNKTNYFFKILCRVSCSNILLAIACCIKSY